MSDEWDEGFVESDGTRIHYTRTGGEKPPLVIAHGLFDDALCRTPMIRELEPDYDVVPFDARAHGRSDAPESGYEMDDRVADLVAVLDGLDVDEAILVGHSMGGSTVASTAARHPERVRGVVMIDPAGMLRSDEDHADDAVDGENEDEGDNENDGDDADGGLDDLRGRVQWWHDHSKAELLEADDELRELAASGDEELAALLADARLRLSQRIVAIVEHAFPDPRDVYPEIEAPTLILKADADAEARARHEAIADLLPDGRIVHVDDAGHCVFRDQRTVATAELRAFLGEL